MNAPYILYTKGRLIMGLDDYPIPSIIFFQLFFLAICLNHTYLLVAPEENSGDHQFCRIHPVGTIDVLHPNVFKVF